MKPTTKHTRAKLPLVMKSQKYFFHELIPDPFYNKKMLSLRRTEDTVFKHLYLTQGPSVNIFHQERREFGSLR